MNYRDIDFGIVFGVGLFLLAQAVPYFLMGMVVGLILLRVGLI